MRAPEDSAFIEATEYSIDLDIQVNITSLLLSFVTKHQGGKEETKELYCFFWMLQHACQLKFWPFMVLFSQIVDLASEVLGIGLILS